MTISCLSFQKSEQKKKVFSHSKRTETWFGLPKPCTPLLVGSNFGPLFQPVVQDFNSSRSLQYVTLYHSADKFSNLIGQKSWLVDSSAVSTPTLHWLTHTKVSCQRSSISISKTFITHSVLGTFFFLFYKNFWAHRRLRLTQMSIFDLQIFLQSTRVHMKTYVYTVHVQYVILCYIFVSIPCKKLEM